MRPFRPSNRVRRPRRSVTRVIPTLPLSIWSSKTPPSSRRGSAPLDSSAYCALDSFADCAERRFCEAVAHAADGLDVVAGGADLLAQALHVRIDGAGRDLRVHTPNVI